MDTNDRDQLTVLAAEVRQLLMDIEEHDPNAALTGPLLKKARVKMAQIAILQNRLLDDSLSSLTAGDGPKKPK